MKMLQPVDVAIPLSGPFVMVRKPVAKTCECAKCSAQTSNTLLKPLHASWHDCGAKTLANAVSAHDAMMTVKKPNKTEENEGTTVMH